MVGVGYKMSLIATSPWTWFTLPVEFITKIIFSSVLHASTTTTIIGCLFSGLTTAAIIGGILGGISGSLISATLYIANKIIWFGVYNFFIKPIFNCSFKREQKHYNDYVNCYAEMIIVNEKDIEEDDWDLLEISSKSKSVGDWIDLDQH
jgi:hypothetical protein